MKKGRHRRFEEARALKRMSTDFDAELAGENEEACEECGADPGHDHASWCLLGQNEDNWAS